MKIIFPIALFILLISCQTQDPPEENFEVIFTGEIQNNRDTTASLFIDMMPDKLTIDSNKFQFVQEFDRPYIFNIRLAKNIFSCYVVPGDSIHIEFDKSDFENTLSYSGSRSKENLFLKQFSKTLGKLTENREELYSLEEPSFLSRIDSMKTGLKELVVEFSTSSSDLEPNFIKLLDAEINYNYADQLNSFKRLHIRYAEDTSYMKSETLLQLQKAIKYEDPVLIGSTTFREGLFSKIWALADEKKGEDEDFGDAVLGIIGEDIDSAFTNPDISEYAKYFSLVSSVNWFDFDKSVSAANNYIETTENKVYAEQLKKNIAIWDNLKKGSPAPDFQYPDIHNMDHALSDYRGKYVYLDVWATWCGPCVAEHPALIELEEKYHDNPNIVFMAVSVDKDRDAWERMITKKNLGGVQLILEEGSFDIQKDYNISGIPRFVLIDKDGKLINARAPRPSSDKIKDILKNLLEESSDLLGYTR